MSDADAQFFADGDRWDIAVVIGVVAILAGGMFGWQGTAAVLAVPAALLLIAGATFAFVILVMRSVVNNIDDSVEDIGDEE